MMRPQRPASVARVIAAVLTLPVSLLSGELDSSIEPPPDAGLFSGSLSVGYDSAYVLRGASFGDHAPWSDVSIDIPLEHGFALNMGAWYINPTRNAFVNDELDFYGYLSYALENPRLGPWEFEVGGAWSGYLEDDADETEVSFKVTKPVGEVFDLAFEYVYDITFSGQYFEYSAEKAIPLCDKLDLTLSGGIAHGNDRYTFDVIGGEHVFVRAETTYQITETLGIGAYLLQNCPFGKLATAGQESGLYGGASLSVSF